MEQPCYQCGQIVEEGVPFCPHCAAPQIRVVIAESPPIPLPAIAGASVATATSYPTAETISPIRGAHLLKPCGLAALIACILTILGLNLFVSMISAGFLAVMFYRQRTIGTYIRPIIAAGIGALAGSLFFALGGTMMALAAASPAFRTKFRDLLLDSAQKWVASRPADAQFQAALEQLKTPQGLVTTLVLSGILLFILCPLVASLGGALAGFVLGGRRKP